MEIDGQKVCYLEYSTFTKTFSSVINSSIGRKDNNDCRNISTPSLQ